MVDLLVDLVAYKPLINLDRDELHQAIHAQYTLFELHLYNQTKLLDEKIKWFQETNYNYL